MQVKAANKAIQDRLMMKNTTVRAALKDIDEDGSGIISREEASFPNFRAAAFMIIRNCPLTWVEGKTDHRIR